MFWSSFRVPLDGGDGPLNILPVHQIQQMSFSTGSGSVFARLLVNLPNLVDVSLSMPADSVHVGPPTPIFPPTMHRAIRTLPVSGQGNNRIGLGILNFVSTPSIMDLELSSFSAWRSPVVSLLLERSGRHPHKSVLRDIRLRATKLLAVLRTVPTLESLVFVKLSATVELGAIMTAPTPCTIPILYALSHWPARETVHRPFTGSCHFTLVLWLETWNRVTNSSDSARWSFI
ncbi:hypothetical protein B0H10DRAFT_2197961 [Mycena sp. CBHHK59/15]|nr:hypothetical protein B0H10DRAFT_2197961 [Mycena sp. CBHHK59/15]